MVCLAVLLCAGCGPGSAELDLDEGEDTVEAALVTLNRPLDVTVTVLASAHTLRVQWTDTNSNESLTAIERSAATPLAFARVGKVAANVTSFDDVFAPADWSLGNSYAYRVRARAANGDVSRESGRVLASTDTLPPTAATNLRSTGTTETTIALAWDAATDNAGVDHYEVYRDGAAISAPVVTSFTDSGLWPHSTHTYYLAAVDAAGNRSPITPLVTAFTKNDVTAPTAPGPVTASFDRSTVSVRIGWGASTDNVRLDHYVVFRNLVAIATVSATTTTYTDAAPGQNATPKYSLGAVDEFGNIAYSTNQVLVVTDVDAPTQPAALHVTSSTTASISLAWTASTDNFAVQSYDIFQDGVKVANQSAGLGGIWYRAGLASATGFRFKVVARDATGNTSAASNEVTATTR
jgi:chitodextrinase